MDNSKQIFVNQVGYGALVPKIAYAVGFKGGEQYSVLDENGQTVLTGKLSKPVEDSLTGFPVCSADFSSLKKDGKFTIQCQEAKSCSFKAGKSVYKKLYFSVLDYFRLSRCGQKIEGGKWSHEPCHTGIAEVYGNPELKLDIQGGWHDAGDYGRYIVAGSKTVMDLLLAYNISKDKFSDFDILDEVRFELEWMLKMQREDGGVYHKISCYHFCAFIAPEQEKDKIVIAPVSTTATADFAGCCAYASGFYSERDNAFSRKLLSAAEKAQEYLSSHEDEPYKNPPEITTGGYGDCNVRDERYFALCSLFTATGKTEYLEMAARIRSEVLNLAPDPQNPWKNNWSESFGWGSVAGYGTELLLTNASAVSAANNPLQLELIAELKAAVIQRADGLLEIVENASFNTCVKKFFWGSNGHMCDEAHVLLLAAEITGEKKYEQAAFKQINYILGCNPMNICYVTGNGTFSPKHPHHRPSGAAGSAMPGMLVGGAASGLADQVAKDNLQGKTPVCCYIDMQGSYSTNEVAIYWNSPLVLLLANVL